MMKHLGIKLALQISATLIAAMAIFITVYTYQQHQKDLMAFGQKEERIMKQLALIMETPLYHIDYAQMESIILSYLSDADILAIKVLEDINVAKFMGRLPNTDDIIDLDTEDLQYVDANTKQATVSYKGSVLGAIEVTFSRQAITQHLQDTLITLIGSLFLIITLASLLIAFVVKRNVTIPLLSLNRTAHQIAEGDINIHLQQISSRNEIGQLQSAMKHMIQYIQDVAKVAERISNQDLQIEVVPKSGRDVLNHSLAKMIDNLRQMIAENMKSMAAIEEQNQRMKQQNWSKDGISQLNAALSGDHSLTEICNTATSFVARYIKAGHGVMYTYDAEQKNLHLQGTFAFTERDHLSNTYKLGEGVIGQVALEGEPILLRLPRRDEQLVTTGTFSGTPLNTYTFPLIYNDDMYGVFELASFEIFDEHIRGFLDDANQVIATALFSAFQRERVQTLLRFAQQNNES